MDTVKFYLVVFDEKPDQIRGWLSSLTPAQRNEYASLDYAHALAWETQDPEEDPINKACQLSSIMKDWIEEYGGDQGWWMSIFLMHSWRNFDKRRAFPVEIL